MMVSSLIRVPESARAFLRLVRNCDGSLRLETPLQRDLAATCVRAGALTYVEGARNCVSITDAGINYLDRLMRAA